MRSNQSASEAPMEAAKSKQSGKARPPSGPGSARSRLSGGGASAFVPYVHAHRVLPFPRHDNDEDDERQLAGEAAVGALEEVTLDPSSGDDEALYGLVERQAAAKSLWQKSSSEFSRRAREVMHVFSALGGDTQRHLVLSDSYGDHADSYEEDNTSISSDFGPNSRHDTDRHADDLSDGSGSRYFEPSLYISDPNILIVPFHAAADLLFSTHATSPPAKNRTPDIIDTIASQHMFSSTAPVPYHTALQQLHEHKLRIHAERNDDWDLEDTRDQQQSLAIASDAPPTTDRHDDDNAESAFRKPPYPTQHVSNRFSQSDPATGLYVTYNGGNAAKKRRRRFILVTSAFLAALISMALTIYIMARNSSHGGNNGGETDSTIGNDVDSSTPPPLPAPSTVPTSNILWLDQLKAKIVPEITILTPTTILSNTSTPQHMAIQWLLDDIGSNTLLASQLLNRTVGLEQVVQRYILATIYYSTRGPLWRNRTNWLTSEHVCTWFGVTCGNGSLPEDGGATQPVSKGNNTAAIASMDNTEVMVTFIYLSSNGLTGTIPPEVGDLSALTQLWVYDNSLMGKIPESMLKLSNLNTLHLGKNLLTSVIPKEIGKLSKLRYVDLSDNFLSGRIPGGIGNIADLVDLRLSNNKLVGAIPPEIVNLDALRTLLLDRNSLGGTLPTRLSRLKDLTVLRLYDNELFGSIPQDIVSPMLDELHLDNNAFSGSLPQFVSSPLLRELHVGKNKLSGSLPATLDNLSNLELLRLGVNNLSGFIPTELGNLVKLKDFSLEYNDISGSIPNELSHLDQLEVLYLGHNKITGSIPTWIHSFSRLEQLYLNDNGFSGLIPPNMTIATLSKLRLENNAITGSITGSISDSICGLTNITLLTVDCEKIQCNCTTQCYPI